MASTSSSTAAPQWKYDVFLSFRGADTRDGFVSHLYAALDRGLIVTFIDDRLEGGDEISPALLEKIGQSSISVVLFSKNYADSPWCLEELEKIHECKETLGQKVLPVFYNVDPTHVQELSDSYGDALAEHQRKSSSEKVKRWGRALTEIANLKGWDSNKVKPEAKLIEVIVHAIRNKVNQLYAKTASDFRVLVGIDSRVKEVESLLCVGAPGVRIVGIWGMGGIGKTTLADAIYNKISAQFEGQSFLFDIRQQLETSTTLALRNKILSEILGNDIMGTSTLNFLPMPTKITLQRRKVLIVLDDVTDSGQLDELLGEVDLLGQGSRVLVTSRDKQVLNKRCDQIYKAKELEYHEAVQLFRLHAFRRQICPTGEHMMQLSRRIVEYAEGLPLVLRVLGSSLNGKDVEEWESALAKLKSIPDSVRDIQKILRISYDGLDTTERNMFLDIACFFGTCSKDLVQKIFDRSLFFPKIGLRGLSDKCLINISGDMIWMHDLLQQLARNIVLEETDPRKRSRLWIPEDICDVLTHYKGSETVKAISLDISKIRQLKLSSTVFEDMYHLRLLKFYNTDPFKENIILFPEGLKFLSNKLVVLHWEQCSLKSLPSNFCPENLVELRMPGSRLTNLSGLPRLVHLKLMDLSKCESLVEVPPSILFCSGLTLLDLSFCGNLRCLPSLLHLTSLKDLNLVACEKIEELPEFPLNIQTLSLSGTGIKQVPSSIGLLSQLVDLDLDRCKRLKSVPSSVGQLKRLKKLGLRGCYNIGKMLHSPTSHLCYLHDLHLDSCGISEIPDTLGSLVSLETLDLTRNDFKRIPASIKQLPNLKSLHLRQCRRLQCLPDLPSSLKELDVSHCSSLKSVHSTFTRVRVDRYEKDYFSFAHCYCLDENACSRIMADYYLRITRIRILRTMVQKFWFFSRVDLCIPGNDVPEWFIYKTTVGSSLQIIKPRQTHRYTGFLGCIVCAVVAPKELRDFGHDWGRGRVLNVRCSCSFRAKSSSTTFVCKQDVIGGIDKPHVFIWYQSNFRFDCSKYVACKIDFSDSTNWFEGHQIIKWGVFPILNRR